MTFAVSPGVSFNEFDLSLTVPAIAATPAAFSGIFRWGPMFQPVLLGSQLDLQKRFLTPTNLNGETYFTAYNYLAYGDQLWLVRTGDVTGNTVEQTSTGASNTMTGGNNVVLLNNTVGFAIGMKLFYSNVTALSPTQTNGVYITQVNTTSITLSSAPSSNAGNCALIFRSNIFYNGVAQQNQVLNLSWATYNVLNANIYTQIANTFDPSICYVSRYPGYPGNSLRISQIDTAAQYSSNLNLLPNVQINATATTVTANVGANTLLLTVVPANPANATQVSSANALIYTICQDLAVGDYIQIGNTFIDFEFLQVTNTGINAISLNATGNVFTTTISLQNPYTLIANIQMTNIQRYWEFAHLVGVAPGQSQYVYNNGNTAAQDQMSMVVVDELGMFSGNPGEVLEVYANLSRATDAINLNGTPNYYANVINGQSSYIWFANDRAGATSALATQIASSTATNPLDIPFSGGDNGLGEGNVSIATIANGFNMFSSPEDIDIGLILTGKGLGIPFNSNTQLATWLINNIAEERRDCVVFCSPDIADVVNNAGNEAVDIVAARNTMPSSSYGFMDSGYKYTYDPFNNVYRWVPLNGDIAGLAAQTDHTHAPWWSFAGFNRGNVKNVIKLAWNPAETDRDILYPAGVNPVVTFKGGLGTVLYGDKTLFAEPSAFNRINVRRLFIVLEKSIATAAKFDLFEFNDAFTRAQFVSMVAPFLDLVKAQRGLIQYVVRCDTSNNPPQVIQNNQFVADIFIQPNYSINFIKLNFVNVPPTVSFSEAESIQY